MREYRIEYFYTKNLRDKNRSYGIFVRGDDVSVFEDIDACESECSMLVLCGGDGEGGG